MMPNVLGIVESILAPQLKRLKDIRTEENRLRAIQINLYSNYGIEKGIHSICK